jgi:uncharacterized protein (DUF1697 family)
MTVVISLLRGVNVGGHAKIKMDALRELYAALGLTTAQTLLQSGNVVFKAKASELPRLAGRLESAIEERFGCRPQVMLRTAAGLNKTLAANPFHGRTDLNPSGLLVLFLGSQPSAEARASTLALPRNREELVFAGGELFAYFPDGIGMSRLASGMIERTLKIATTGRNWNTVNKLSAIAAGLAKL